ncbi:GntR family transcriptional regulator [Polaribacter septentrionalilitoris]|uniref:GntR family transcriptional regulator n=1 Tax=Polaribacter septentrionalilitoris TaxID=2494657 RepID=UPI00135B3952|nr:GntR family transcriptional regulator [Polaribacter septentrionalilitoris]
MGIVSLKNNIGVPKYKQIVTSIEDAIANGNLKKGDQLPSLNAIKNKHKLSRDTVLTAFNELKNRGIIHSVVGKGYYVSSENIFVKQKIFVLFDELNSFKEDLYNSFLEHLGDDIQIDIFFHHFNKDIFNKLINDSVGNYSYYVIMPANLENTKTIIQNLPSEKVYLLDQVPKELESYPSVYQDFENDIQKGLFTGLHAIRKYKKLVLVFSHKQPKQLLNGFKNFCEKYKKTYEVIETIYKRNPKKGELYIVFEDKDLIKIIKKIKEQKLQIVKDIGIISYNDTLLKEVVADGITTISTDFKLMGETLAKKILNNDLTSVINPSKLLFRKSI